MEMYQDGVQVFCLPDNACCSRDEKLRNPLDIDVCPIDNEICNGDCFYYCEE